MKTKKWQTVGWLIEELKGFDPDERLEFYAGRGEPCFPISIYPNEDGTGCNVDLEEEWGGLGETN